MAGGRRNAKSSSFNKHQSHAHHAAADDRHHSELPTQPLVTPPKHIPLPDIPPSSDLNFEIDSLILSLFVMVGQYIHLYRSVFWLPHSYTEDALNFYLIDIYVLAFGLAMIGRRLPVCLLKKICSLCLPTSYHPVATICIHILIMTILSPVLLYCSYFIFNQYGITNTLFLLYPFAVFVIVMGTNLTRFLELITLPKPKETGARSKHTPSVKPIPGVNHVCSMSAHIIRDEVESLRKDFNIRWKQVLLNTFLIIYYGTFLPCYFAQPELLYDVAWTSQHGVFSGMSCFILYVTHCFPPRYCDVLHRAALHLGRWQKVETKNVHVPYSTWTESATWNQGALVKHSKELFKAEGISNAAEPGNSTHSRFYSLFRNPAYPTQIVFVFHILLVSALFLMLCQSYVWNELLPIQLLILINCKTLYWITKVYFVVKKIYHEERVLISKFCS